MIWEELRDDLIFYDLQAVDYKRSCRAWEMP